MLHLAPVLLATLLLAGCTASPPADECSADASCAAQLVCAPVAAAEVRHNADPAPTTAPATADLTLVVSSSSGPAERVVVRTDDDLLLDALLPPGSDYCGGPPVFTWAYDLPAQPVNLTVSAGGQQVSVAVSTRRRVSVTVQDDLPLDVQTAPA